MKKLRAITKIFIQLLVYSSAKKLLFEKKISMYDFQRTISDTLSKLQKFKKELYE